MPEDQTLSQSKILLVIDSTPLRLLLQRVLERCGFDIVTAESAEAARPYLGEIVAVVSHLPESDSSILLNQLERRPIRHFELEPDTPVELDALLKFINQQN